jgi:hypothetical protein
MGCQVVTVIGGVLTTLRLDGLGLLQHNIAVCRQRSTSKSAIIELMTHSGKGITFASKLKVLP